MSVLEGRAFYLYLRTPRGHAWQPAGPLDSPSIVELIEGGYIKRVHMMWELKGSKPTGLKFTDCAEQLFKGKADGD